MDLQNAFHHERAVLVFHGIVGDFPFRNVARDLFIFIPVVEHAVRNDLVIFRKVELHLGRRAPSRRRCGLEFAVLQLNDHIDEFVFCNSRRHFHAERPADFAQCGKVHSAQFFFVKNPQSLHKKRSCYDF